MFILLRSASSCMLGCCAHTVWPCITQLETPCICTLPRTLPGCSSCAILLRNSEPCSLTEKRRDKRRSTSDQEVNQSYSTWKSCLSVTQVWCGRGKARKSFKNKKVLEHRRGYRWDWDVLVGVGRQRCNLYGVENCKV